MTRKLEKEEMNLLRSIIIVFVFIIAIIFYGFLVEKPIPNNAARSTSNKILAISEVAPIDGVVLSVKWNDLGAKMVLSGIIDSQKFESIYARQGGLTDLEKNMLYGNNNSNIVITRENSGFILNMLWGFGLGNKNPILENGEMSDPKYGGAERFASTGGWTIAKGNPMNHYSKHEFVMLTSKQQLLVDNISQNIYRPCCGNSTHFPDCNHGMAMLGLLEIMASQGMNEQDMYSTALIVNSYWFPDTYKTIQTYMRNKGIDWKDVNPKEILGADYSSGIGYQNIASQVIKPQQGGGSSCGL